jgi:hypothetical protein
MRYLTMLTALGLPLSAPAGDLATKEDFADLSRLIHKMVVKQVPREHEEKIDWGKSTPIPEKLLAPRLPRTYIKVGDQKELAHGNWKRVHVKLEDPDKDLRIKVKEFRKLDKGGYRVVIDSEASLRCDGEMIQWLRGLQLLKVDGQADATIASTMVCDVDIAINFKKFPPDVKVDPKIVELGLDLKDFNLRQISGIIKGNVKIEGEKLRQTGQDVMPDLIRSFMKASEPIVKEYANQAIAQSLREGKGKLSAAELLKAAPKEEKKEK